MDDITLNNGLKMPLEVLVSFRFPTLHSVSRRFWTLSVSVIA